MSPSKSPIRKRPQGWLLGVLITAFTVLTMMGLANSAPLVAWIVSAVGLVGLVGFFYWAGRSK